ncbi:MAG: DUF521 domain-containing protein [Chloroflexi bacterium]|nr:DUF521 domain-containing protein [Chloroflexota bacterium]
MARSNNQIELSESDSAALEGAAGPAVKMAMRILVKMAVLYGARALLDITQAHIDSTVYIGDAGLEYAEGLANMGAKVAVPTTLNVSGVDEYHWQEWPVPPEWAGKARRQMDAYQNMGCTPTWTCAPYQTEQRPQFGQQVAWGESSAIVFANSVIGARTERYPDLLDICCAITGRAPAAGLHLSENRAGQVLLHLVDVPIELQETDTFYTVLGFLMGRLVDDEVPVLVGLEVEPGEDQLKALGATAASTGRTAMFHVVGVTPEAPTLDIAFHGKEPQRQIDISEADLREARRKLSTTGDARLDMIVLGSPHFSLAEFSQLQLLITGQLCSPDLEFVVTSSRGVALLAERAGYLQSLRRFGGKLTVDTCILTTPMLPDGVETIMTNAGKFAYYVPGLLGAQVVFGTLQECIASAIAGRILLNDELWNE